MAKVISVKRVHATRAERSEAIAAELRESIASVRKTIAYKYDEDDIAVLRSAVRELVDVVEILAERTP